MFVFKLHFSPNRVYKPCLGRGDHSLPYCLESERDGILHYFTKDMLHFLYLYMENLNGIWPNLDIFYRLRQLDIGDGNFGVMCLRI